MKGRERERAREGEGVIDVRGGREGRTERVKGPGREYEEDRLERV